MIMAIDNDDGYLWFPCLVEPKVVVVFVATMVVTKTATFEKYFWVKATFLLQKTHAYLISGTYIWSYIHAKNKIT